MCSTLGARIKHARKASKLTQVELAKKVNLSRSYIGDIEIDRYNPSVSTLQSIADALYVDVSYLLGEKRPAPPAPLSPADIPQLPATGANFALLPQAPASPASAAPATPVLPAPGRLPIDPPLTDKEIDIALSYRYGTQDTRDLIDYAISRDKNQDASTSAAASPEAS